MAKEISNSDDIIDSRDVIARIEELTSDLEIAFEDAKKEYEDAEERAKSGTPLEACYSNFASAEEYGKYYVDLSYSDEQEELAKLKALAAECEGYGDWEHGETLIRETNFRDYAEEFAEDVGYIQRDVRWPYNHIDWEAAANELKMDYTAVDFDGVEYLMRA